MPVPFASRIARFGIGAAALILASTSLGGMLAAQPAGGTAAPAAPAAPAAKPASATTDAGAADKIKKGRDLFANWSCNSCHSLADAGATGHVGPSLDSNPNLTEAFVVSRVTNGQGAMPAFGGQMSDEEIATIAFYITHVTAK